MADRVTIAFEKISCSNSGSFFYSSKTWALRSYFLSAQIFCICSHSSCSVIIGNRSSQRYCFVLQHRSTLPLLLSLPQLFIQNAPQRCSADPQPFGGNGLIIVFLPQNPVDNLFFNIPQGHVQIDLVGQAWYLTRCLFDCVSNIRSRQIRFVCIENCSAQYPLDLADIARPGICFQFFQRFLRHPYYLLTVLDI